MKKRWLLLFVFTVDCTIGSDKPKELDLNDFKMSIPKAWHYKKIQGEDSFVGEIDGPNLKLDFDYSTRGYANNLIPTEQEYLNNSDWKEPGYFYKVGVIYTANFNVKNERAAQMKKLGTTDSTLVHVEADPSYETKTTVHLPAPAQKIKYPEADYIADLRYRDSTINVPIKIPVEIKSHHIQIDSTDEYVIKTIWPKLPSKGITGIAIKGRVSSLTFNMVGVNLSLHDQQLALKTFKTIKFKDQ